MMRIRLLKLKSPFFKRAISLLILLLAITPCIDGQELFPYRKDSLWGYCDSNKNVAIPVQYEIASIFSKCGIATVKMNGKYHFIAENGRRLNQSEYDKWAFFGQSRTSVWQSDKVGLIDSTGNEFVPIKYDEARFAEGKLSMKLEGYWAIFDYYSGRRRSKFKYEDILTNSHYLYGVKSKEKWGFANSKGRIKIQPKYDEIQGFSEQGLCAVKKGENWGFINLKGNLIGELKYSQVQNFQQEGVWVKQNNKWGLIDVQGTLIIPYSYDEVSYFKEGLAAVKLDGKYGFVNNHGETIIPSIYEKAFEFSEGLASVCIASDSCGYIDRKGEKVIPFLFQRNYGSEFKEGLAEVRKNDYYGFINKKGELIVPIKYHSPFDYNRIFNGVGLLVDPKTNEEFYFNLSGTIFFQED